ncbi:Toxin HigB / Protein kinase domain of HipA [hydrothermal vent metagenome]|uniref:Toxin HigB / Protein kinase domain of HipA n=1 Tax=hydrothermal vent metagenome TaxID=652676 RepID=A0A3B0YS20_9ZZZZ
MKNSVSLNEIKIGLNFGGDVIPVGRLAIRDRKIYFEYHASFIERGIEISPLHLPVKTGVSSFDAQLFEGLPGVFNDSVADGWGRLLFDRFARSRGALHSDITPLDRLAHVGTQAMGALVFEPDHSDDNTGDGAINLDLLAAQTQDVLEGASGDILQALLALNGSSAGARPKALIALDKTRQHISYGVKNLPESYESWIVKFANTQDGFDVGAIEYVYARMAADAGIQMPVVHLFTAQQGAGYFAVKRFDRNDDKRFHMHTACGLLHSDFRIPALDYEDLIALTAMLTRDVREVEKLYRLAVFNVLAYNRDDHAKNFSFLMNEQGQWKLSPAYDLSFSSGPRGEQSTMILGEGRDPGIEHLVKLGSEAGLPEGQVSEILDQTQSSLGQWKTLAKEHNVSATNIRLIKEKLKKRGR